MSVFIADIFTKALDDEYKNRKTYNNESELAYKLPDIFKEKNHANDSYENFSYYGNKDSCTVDISNYEIYSEKTAEEYLKDSITTNMNETVSEIKSKEINQNITQKYNHNHIICTSLNQINIKNSPRQNYK